MSLRQKAIKGVIWSAIESWGNRAITFVVFFLLARLLSPEVFGLVALASVFLAFIQIFLDQGFSSAIIQRKDLEPEHLDTAFWVNLAISVFLTTLSILSADWVSALFKEPALTPVLRWLSLSFLFSAFISVQQALFQRKLAFNILAKRSLIATAISGIVGVTMALRGMGVWSLVGQQLSNSLVQVLILWGVSDWRPGFRVSKRHFRDLFSFGINIMGSSFFNFFNRRSDDFLIGYFLGATALGYYSVAYRLLLIASDLLTTTISKVTLPTFSKMQAEPERLRNTLYLAVHITCLIAFPGFLGIAAMAPEIVRVVFGEVWLPSIPVMQILNLIGPLYACFYFNGPLMMAVGKPSWKLKLDCLQAICNLTAFAISVRWGITAVAAAYIIRSYLTAPLSIWLIQKLIRVNVLTYLRQGVTPLVGTLVMLIAIFAVRYFLNPLFGTLEVLIASTLAGVTVYLATVLLIEPKIFRQIMSLAR